MYHTCLYCHGDLGSNQVLERFPVGRRLAFDPARGRIWVICRRCRRWNLSPLETRWEALEEMERLHATLRRRVATPDIALAWAAGGLQLVRIGPGAPTAELAAWRYGRTLLWRRVRAVPIALGAAAVVALAGAATAAGGPYAGVLAAGYAGYWIEHLVHGKRRRDRVVGWARFEAGGQVPVWAHDVRRMRVTPVGSRWYSIRVMNEPQCSPWKDSYRKARSTGLIVFSGREELRVARLLLPQLNPFGGSGAQVTAATRILEEAGGSESFLVNLGKWRTRPFDQSPEQRLAFEMAFNEESERAALDQELSELELEWAGAEEVARIADTLGLSQRVVRRLRSIAGR